MQVLVVPAQTNGRYYMYVLALAAWLAEDIAVRALRLIHLALRRSSTLWLALVPALSRSQEVAD